MTSYLFYSYHLKTMNFTIRNDTCLRSWGPYGIEEIKTQPILVPPPQVTGKRQGSLEVLPSWPKSVPFLRPGNLMSLLPDNWPPSQSAVKGTLLQSLESSILPTLGATLLSRKPVLPAFQRHLLLEH
jgi:hypothetical protein